MNQAEWGYLLLCCDMGGSRKPLTLPQLQRLRTRARTVKPTDPDAPLTVAHLRQIGYSQAEADDLIALFQQESMLEDYLSAAKKRQILPLTYASPQYPQNLRQSLGVHAPAVLFFRGKLSLLSTKAVALVGSRQISPAGAAFAQQVGILAAKEGYTLISGNARGADRLAQNACLAHGGSVVSVVADPLDEHHPDSDQILYVAESGWHLPFSAARALGRNRLIHALAQLALVAQTGNGHGGTWQGVTENLRQGYCPVIVHDDGSPGAARLIAMGGQGIALPHLRTLAISIPTQAAFWPGSHGMP